MSCENHNVLAVRMSRGFAFTCKGLHSKLSLTLSLKSRSWPIRSLTLSLHCSVSLIGMPLSNEPSQFTCNKLRISEIKALPVFMIHFAVPLSLYSANKLI